jgi:hypothetical protein
VWCCVGVKRGGIIKVVATEAGCVLSSLEYVQNGQVQRSDCFL